MKMLIEDRSDQVETAALGLTFILLFKLSGQMTLNKGGLACT